jgi:geranylgeranyl pyrophosphate synthase
MLDQKTKLLYKNATFTTASWSDPIKDQMAMVETRLRETTQDQHQMLTSTIQDIFDAGGKRVRPSLCLLTAGLFNADMDNAITLSAAVEMLHTATLIHDDLIDGAFFRRGAPTLNTKWSSDVAVLAGDYLFARAASMISEVEIIPIMKQFAKTLEIILNGEITQKFSKWQIDRKAYEKRIYAKTAALFVLSTHSAGLLGAAERKEMEAISNFGYSVGMAFQIIDDILDYAGTPHKLGKPIGGDLSQGLFTLPAIYYAEHHPEDKDLKTLLKRREPDQDLIQPLIKKIQNSEAIEAALMDARVFIDEAENMLSAFPDSRYKDALINLANKIANREI